MLVYLVIAIIVFFAVWYLDHVMNDKSHKRYGALAFQVQLGISLLWPFVLVLLLILYIMDDY